MKKLTGKVLLHFEYWLKTEMIVPPDNGIEALGELFLNALIIEWLDSVGIYIEIGGFNIATFSQFWYNIQEERTINGQNGSWFESRSEATSEAILKAVQIFNNRP